MSKLNNISATNGEPIKISIANTTIKEINNSSKLPSNTLIISSKLVDNEDCNNFGILATDNDGMTAVLSKTIKQGNGLTLSNDTISLKFDNKISNNNGLNVNLINCIDNDTLTITNDKIAVNTSTCVIATPNTAGLAKIDNASIKKDNHGSIYVDVDLLSHASVDNFGPMKIDGSTLESKDGIINVNTNNLSAGSNFDFGVVKIDNTLDNSAKLTAKTANLTVASVNECGILKGDEKTINVSNGIVSINKDQLDKATTETFGLIKFNKNYFNLCNGVVSYKYYTDIMNKLNSCEKKLRDLKNIIY